MNRGKRKYLYLISIVCISTLIIVIYWHRTESILEKAHQNNGVEINHDKKSLDSDFILTDEPLKLKMVGMKSTVHGDWNNMSVFKEYEKMTHINVSFTAIPEEIYRDKLGLILPGSELPDAFFRGALQPIEVAEYGASGTLIPLETLIEHDAPNFKKLMEKYEEVRSACISSDGHIYSLPAIVTVNSARTDKHWINKEWLDKAHLTSPETTEELKEVLRIFRDRDMNGNGIIDDEIPMTGENIEQIIDNFTGAFGLQLQMGYAINIDKDKVNIWLKSERYKMLLQYIAELYQENLLDQQIFNSNHQIFVPKINSGKVGAFHNQADDIFSKDNNAFIGIAPWKGPMGDRVKNMRPIARDFGAFAITSSNQYPEVTMKWLDYFYGEEGSAFFRMGIKGKTYEELPSGDYIYSQEIRDNPLGIAVAMGDISNWPGRGAPHLINNKNAVGINSSRTQYAQQKLDPYLVTKVYNRPILDTESERRFKELKGDIDLYTETTREMFIKGKLSFNEWETYCKTIDQIGLQELENLYQKAYDSLRNSK